MSNSGSGAYMSNSGLESLERITDYSDPNKFESKNLHLRPLFKEILRHKASDIFIHEGKKISALINNKLYAVTERNITRTEAQWFLLEMAGKTAITLINAKIPINTTFPLFDDEAQDGENPEIESLTRARNTFRVSVVGTIQAGAHAFQIVLRSIPSEPIHYLKLGLNEKFVLRCCPTKGTVYIAGVTGSGKTTTLASIIKYIAENDTVIKGNIITHEEPIEFTYDRIISKHSIIVQSQIPENFNSFIAANREALRRKPAAILVGELRDAETISSAVEASLTGHPVFATVHAGNVVEILTRLLSKFENDKNRAMNDILSTAAMFVAQRLIPKVDGKLIAVREYLFIPSTLKKRLLKIKDPLDLIAEIQLLMENGTEDEDSIASPTFEKQGEALMAAGIINEYGMQWLLAT